MKLSAEELRHFAEHAERAEASHPPEPAMTFAQLVAARRAGLARRG